jgi:hypothetical protein
MKINFRIFTLSLFLFANLFFSSLFSQEKYKKEQSNKEIMDENKKALNESKSSSGKMESVSEKYSPNRFMIGADIGTPTGANLDIAWYFKKFALRGSGMYYYNKWNGAQADLGYVFYKTDVIMQSFSIVGGYFNVEPFNPQVGSGGQNRYHRFDFPGYQNDPATLTDNLIRAWIANQNPYLAAALDYEFRTRQKAPFHQNYIGLTYDVYLSGFFLQVGAGTGAGDYRNPQLLFKLGYFFDFGR